MDENQMDENRIGRKALDQNRLDENWAHGTGSTLITILLLLINSIAIE